MNKKREDGTVYIAALSGGQDSTAMTLKLLEGGYPVDYVMFNDTTLEFPEMYEYINKIEAFIYRKYGMKIIRTYPAKDFEEWVFSKVSSGENEGLIRGTPMVSLPCFWRREAKEYAAKKWIKEEGLKNVITYIGYTTSERGRAASMAEYTHRAPLIEWGWNENDVANYLKENQMENKLYQHFSRTGCAVCPKQKLDDKYMVYKHYPDTWECMKDMETKLISERKKLDQPVRPAWHDKYYTHELEELFKKKDLQLTFEFDHEPVQDCFCKV